MKRIAFTKRVALSLCTTVLMAHAAGAANCPGNVDVAASPGGVYKLTDNITATGGLTTCINATSSGTIDLNGYSITTNGSTGIKCLSGMTVTDTGATKGAISGNWSYVTLVDCPIIEGIRITGSLGGIWNANIGLQSLRHTLSTVAWFGKVQSRATTISNNYFKDPSALSIDFITNSAGTGNILVSDNTFSSQFSDTTVSTLIAIHLSNIVELRNNLLIDHVGDGAYFGGFAPAAWSANYCEYCPLGSSTCDDSYCTDPSDSAPRTEFPTDPQVCPGTIGAGTYTLTADYDLNATSGACITASQPNTTINLNGHVIVNSATGGSAINCTNNAVTVKDDTLLGGIGRSELAESGSFSTGISGCRTITKMQMKDVATGVSNTSTGAGLDSLTASHIDATGTAVDSYFFSRNSTIDNNWLRGSNTGIYMHDIASGTGKATIINNMIRDAHSYGIRLGSNSTYFNIHDNIIYARSTTDPNTQCLSIGSATNTHMMCNCTGQCETADPPIIYPF